MKLKDLKGVYLGLISLFAIGCEGVYPTQERFSSVSEDRAVHEWYLTSKTSFEDSSCIKNLSYLVDSLANYGVEVVPIPEREYRIDEEYENYFQNSTSHLKDVSLSTLEGVVLSSHAGVSLDSLSVEILDSKLWLEFLIGGEVKSFAYPAHDHDEETMNFVRDSGHIVARCGIPHDRPWSSFLFGHYSNPLWQTSWTACSLYEIPLTVYGCSQIQELDVSEIESWLHSEENLFSWKENNTWVQLYTHTIPDDSLLTNTSTLDTLHLGKVLEILEEDGEVWIGSMSEIGEYFREYHRPSQSEPLIWEMGSTGVPEEDRDYDPALPWDGYKCAFTFSTDDGWKSNLTDFSDLFQRHNKQYTAFLNPDKIMNPNIRYMNESEVLEFYSTGVVEIGNHSFDHISLIPSDFATLSGEGEIEISTVDSENGLVKKLTLVK